MKQGIARVLCKRMMGITLNKLFLSITALAAALFFCAVFCFANAEAAPSPAQAEYITFKCRVDGSGFNTPENLSDADQYTYTNSKNSETVITVESETGIGSLYIIFQRVYGAWTISDGTKTASCGINGYLHEYVNTEALFNGLPLKLTLTFSGARVAVAEIFIYSEGEAPAFVQKWSPPCERADLLLLPTHSDDDQLFFAGVLPYYAGELGYKVQVVYFVNQWDSAERPHEQLDGLWCAGVTNYPVIGPFPDLYCLSLSEALSVYGKKGFKEEDFTAFQTEVLRRFKPLVVIGHDEDGEYGHGAHILNTYTLKKALEAAPDAACFPESAAAYGVWDAPKTYLHLYSENKIIMDWDTPLEHFGGKSAFQVSQEAFGYHKSQHWTWFYRWIYGKTGDRFTLATQVTGYSPREYGLYRTTAGEDTQKNDFFENLMTYEELDAAEVFAREEEARLEAEKAAAQSEAARLESQRLESERIALESEALRLESESMAAQDEAARLDSERLAAQSEADAGNGGTAKKIGGTEFFVIVFAGLAAAAAIFIIIMNKKIRKR